MTAPPARSSVNALQRITLPTLISFGPTFLAIGVTAQNTLAVMSAFLGAVMLAAGLIQLFIIVMRQDELLNQAAAASTPAPVDD